VKSLVRAAVLRHLLRHPGQLLLAVVGVAMGVAVVVALDLAIQSSRAAFRASSETVSGRATHVILGGPDGLADSTFVAVRLSAGIRGSAPVVEGRLTSPAIPGRSVRVLGVDPLSEGPVRPYLVGGGSPGRGGASDSEEAGSAGSASVLIADPSAVLLSRALADEGGLGVGDSIPLRAGGVVTSLRVAGLLDPEGEVARLGAADLLVADLATVQELLGRTGRLSRIDLVLPASSPPEGPPELRSVLPPDARVEPAGARSDTMVQMTRAFDLNLTALSLLAIIFGMFLIYNTMTFSVVQRRELFGALRSLGVTGRELISGVLMEAGVLAGVGSTLGLVAGVVLGRGLVDLVVRTVNDLYFSVQVQSLSVPPLVLAKGLALGVGATLLASLPASIEAATAPPRRTLRRSYAEESASRLAPRAAVGGLLLFLAGGSVLLLSGTSLLVAFGGLFGVILGMALTVPFVTALLAEGAAPVLGGLGGLLAAMAARGVRTTLSRTAPALTALMVAVSVTVGLGTMIQSFRQTVVRWLDHTLQADVYVSLPTTVAARAEGTLDPGILEELRGVGGYAGLSTYRGREFDAPSGPARLVALDLDPRGEGAFRFLGGDGEGTMARFQAGDGVIVSEPFAFRHDVARGDRIDVPTPSGPQALEILGVFYDYGSDQGAVMMARDLYDRFFDDPGVTSLALFVGPGVDSEALVRDLLGTVPAGRTVIVRTNDRLRSASLEVFDRTFQVTVVLRLLAFIVAFVGVLSALMALELERAREFGVMRAWGLTPGQLGKLVFAQTGLMGLVSGVLAVPMGLVLSTVMIFVINKRAFGWTLQMQVGPEVLAQAVGLALVGALVAGIYPAWRMASTRPAVALRGE
jgi:putative ABC transport system permease protein